jgi:hypothetical protein
MSGYTTLANSDAIYLDTSALAKIEKEEGESSRLVRLLVYGSTIPIFTSSVGFGEFIGIIGREEKNMGGAGGYLYHCRQLMVDFDMQKIRRAEPVPDRFQFVQLADQLASKHSKLGGGDLWHLLAVLELRQTYWATTLLSYDKDLIEAAQSEKIQCVDGCNVLPEILVEELKAVHKWVAM